MIKKVISYQQAQLELEQEHQNREEEKAHYLEEFRESCIELFDMRDFEYYSEMTGVPVEDLLLMKAG